MISNFFSYLFSKTFLAGVLTGIVLAVGGIYAYAQVRVRMGGGEQPKQKRYLNPVELTDSTTFGEIQGDPVVINKWATWCVPCKAEMPTLQALYDSTGQDVRLAVVTEQSRDHVRRYLGNADYSMPVYVVDEVPVPLEGRGIPRTYVVRPDGQVVYRHVGVADWNTAPVHRLLSRLRPEAS